MKAVYVLLLLSVVVAMVPTTETRSKSGLFKKIWGWVSSALKKGTTKLQAAKKSYDKITSSVAYETAANILKPFVINEANVEGCTSVCSAQIGSINGISFLGDSVCEPLCEGIFAAAEAGLDGSD